MTNSLHPDHIFGNRRGAERTEQLPRDPRSDGGNVVLAKRRSCRAISPRDGLSVICSGLSPQLDFPILEAGFDVSIIAAVIVLVRRSRLLSGGQDEV